MTQIHPNCSYNILHSCTVVGSFNFLRLLVRMKICPAKCSKMRFIPQKFAPDVGLEPTTVGLKVQRSTD